LIDKGVTMVYPGHGKPFPIEVFIKELKYLTGISPEP
jgi:hypothetical protein